MRRRQTDDDPAMEILILLIPLSVLLALAIGAIFWWSAESGQFDDLEGPGHRILMDDDQPTGAGEAPPPEPPSTDRRAAVRIWCQQ